MADIRFQHGDMRDVYKKKMLANFIRFKMIDLDLTTVDIANICGLKEESVVEMFNDSLKNHSIEQLSFYKQKLIDLRRGR